MGERAKAPAGTPGQSQAHAITTSRQLMATRAAGNNWHPRGSQSASDCTYCHSSPPDGPLAGPAATTDLSLRQLTTTLKSMSHVLLPPPTLALRIMLTCPRSAGIRTRCTVCMVDADFSSSTSFMYMCMYMLFCVLRDQRWLSLLYASSLATGMMAAAGLDVYLHLQAPHLFSLSSPLL